ncbi:MAG: hypothetical protein AB7T49_02760 [Oligoflexales bacterium]
MKMSVFILVPFLFSFGACAAVRSEQKSGIQPATEFDSFVANIESDLKASVNGGTFCNRFWEHQGNTLPLCLKMPWESFSGPTAHATGSLFNADFGYVSLTYHYGNSTGVQPLKAQKTSTGWRLDLDDPEFWEAVAKRDGWHSEQVDGFIMRFAVKPSESVTTKAIKAAVEARVHVPRQLGVDYDEEFHLIFLNDAEQAAKVGYKLGNGNFARDRMVLIDGVLTDDRDITGDLTHELGHVYTIFNRNWTESDQLQTNFFQIEGFATLLTILRGAPFSDSQKHNLSIALRFMSEGLSIADIVGNEGFQKYNHKYDANASYLIAAAALEVIRQKNGMPGLKELWNDTLGASDQEILELVLQKAASDNKGLTEEATEVLKHWSKI